jgi:hypothetical protein
MCYTGANPGIFMGGDPKFLFYLFSNYNYSLTQYQQITVNILLYGLYIIDRVGQKQIKIKNKK